MFLKLKLIYRFIVLLFSFGRGNGDAIFNAGDAFIDVVRADNSVTVKKMFEDYEPELQEMYDSGDYKKLLAEKFDLDKLIQYPTNTLGYHYATFMKARGLDPNFYHDREVNDVMNFAFIWLQKSHDIWHVVTGFETDPDSEVGLQAFYNGQVPSPQAAFAIVIGIFSAVRDFKKDPERIRRLLDLISAGHTLGRKANQLFAIKWGEAYWNKDLEELRTELNIKPVVYLDKKIALLDISASK